MTEEQREKVRAKLDELQVAAVDHGWNRYAAPKALADVRETVEASILSLFTGAGVAVRELEWEIPDPDESAASCRLVTFGLIGGWAEVHACASDRSWWAEIHDDQGQENIAAENLEAAQAVVQEKHAKRVTSALVPGVVSDDARAAMQSAIEYLSMDERGQGIRNMLTAALSLPARSEEEIRADERERLARQADEVWKDETNHWDVKAAMAYCTKWLRDPARSLTNGGA